jgi:hypothetical protein
MGADFSGRPVRHGLFDDTVDAGLKRSFDESGARDQ